MKRHNMQSEEPQESKSEEGGGMNKPGFSRLHSICKRLSWCLVLNGALVLFELSRFRKWFGIEKTLGRWTVVQVFLVPAAAFAWWLLVPRKYPERPKWLETFLFVPVLALGIFLSEAAFVFSRWSIHPLRICPFSWRNCLVTPLSSEKKSADLEWSEDPAVFWSNRVVWLDEEVLAVAHRHGRAYPPIPCHDPVAMKSIRPTSGSRLFKALKPLFRFWGKAIANDGFGTDSSERTHTRRII